MGRVHPESIKQENAGKGRKKIRGGGKTIVAMNGDECHARPWPSHARINEEARRGKRATRKEGGGGHRKVEKLKEHEGVRQRRAETTAGRKRVRGDEADGQ